MQSGSVTSHGPDHSGPDAGQKRWSAAALMSGCLLALAALAVPEPALAKSPALLKGKDNNCASSGGHRIGADQCLLLKPRQAKEAPTVEQASLPSSALRKFCPNLIFRRRDSNGRTRDVTVELSPRSVLYDISDCCPETSFTLTTAPAHHRFTVLGVGRDCFGGTAHFGIEETYRLEQDGNASLLRRVERSETLWKPVGEP